MTVKPIHFRKCTTETIYGETKPNQARKKREYCENCVRHTAKKKEIDGESGKMGEKHDLHWFRSIIEWMSVLKLELNRKTVEMCWNGKCEFWAKSKSLEYFKLKLADPFEIAFPLVFRSVSMFLLVTLCILSAPFPSIQQYDMQS